MSNLPLAEKYSDRVVFIQKKYGTRVEISLDADSISYSLKDYSGQRMFYAPYETLFLSKLPTLTLANKQFFRRILMVPFAFTVVSIMAFNHTALSESTALVGAIGLVVLYIAHLLGAFAITFTQLPMNPLASGSDGHLIRIIHNKSHDLIIDSIRKRWRGRLLSLHGEMNPNNSLEHEPAKLKWLRDRDVIDDNELRIALARIHALANVKSNSDHGHIN